MLKKIKKKSKKAELTTTQLVTIIVLIASFIIILFFIFRLNPGEQTNKEICRNSVLLKSKSQGLAGTLDCRTNYVCISGGGDCENENPTSSIEVDLKDSDETKKAIADELVDCWYMFGEGQVDYGDENLAGKVQCGICSIIEFDEKTQEAFPSITYSEFYDYLRITKKQGSQSYLSYLYGISSLEALDIENQFPMIQIEDDTIFTNRAYSIITGVDSNVFGDDEILRAYIIPKVETGATACNEYITKA